MKVSKIFHWLYAFLMTLPIFSVLFVCAYVALNPNAKDSYSGSSTQFVQSTLQTNEVNSLTDLQVGNVYLFKDAVFVDDTIGNIYFYDYVGELELYINVLGFYYETYDSSYVDEFLDSIYFVQLELNNTKLYFDSSSSSSLIFYIGDYLNNNGASIYFTNIPTSGDYFIVELNQDLLDIVLDSEDIYTHLFFEECPQEYLQYTTYYKEVETTTLDNAFYYSVEQINENPLFSWAQHSFLVDPLNYITGLFGLASSSPIVTMLSYWLTISIVWLVFDLVMYIPLLVHRWLDKGIIE